MPTIEIGATKITITDGPVRSLQSNIKTGSHDDAEFNAAVDGIESLLLAMVCEGLDVTSHAMTKSVATALEAASEYL